MVDHTMEEWQVILKKICPHGTGWIIMGFADFLSQHSHDHGLNTPLRLQHFIAQCAHESDHLKTTQEYASGSAYEGRKDLGNTHSGDGKKFKGRGLIQLTGRANYTAAATALNIPIVDKPEEVERFPDAATVSAWFWTTHNLNNHADKDDVRQVTKIINGGYNGLDQRMAYLKTAKQHIA